MKFAAAALLQWSFDATRASEAPHARRRTRSNASRDGHIRRARAQRTGAIGGRVVANLVLLSLVLVSLVEWAPMGWEPNSIGSAMADPPPKAPTDWGSDHVGQEFPEYLTGDECLFCHRNIGPTWDVNPHQRTFRPATPDAAAIEALAPADATAAADTKLLLGAERMTRFLRRSQQYGKLDLLSAKYVPASAERGTASLAGEAPFAWDTNRFADKCIGCHTTAIDTESRTFSTISLDCVTCHGLVELEHTDDTSKVFLSAKSRDPKKIISICGQCHLRGGHSASSGLPYPNTFVAGDNLFLDYQVDLTDEALERMPVVEQHIYFNARQVAIQAKTSTTCVSCHEVHEDQSESHQGLENAAICATCHKPGTDNGELLDLYQTESEQRPHNQTCAY